MSLRATLDPINTPEQRGRERSPYRGTTPPPMDLVGVEHRVNEPMLFLLDSQTAGYFARAIAKAQEGGHRQPHLVNRDLAELGNRMEAIDVEGSVALTPHQIRDIQACVDILNRLPTPRADVRIKVNAAGLLRTIGKDPQVAPLQLSDTQADALAAFLHSANELHHKLDRIQNVGPGLGIRRMLEQASSIRLTGGTFVFTRGESGLLAQLFSRSRELGVSDTNMEALATVNEFAEKIVR